MMGDRTEAERVQMMGSSLRFFEHMTRHVAGFLSRTAEAFAVERADFFREHTPVTMVVPVANGGEAAAVCILEWADASRPADLEVLILTHRESGLGPWSDRGRTNVRVVLARDDAHETDLLNAGLEASRGAYVAFARPGRQLPRRAPVEFASQMMKQGETAMVIAPFSRALTSTDIAMRLPGTEELRLENLMIHRSLVDGGYRVRGGGTPLESSAAFAAFCRPELAVWHTGE